jgi:hypothetical protein
LPRGQDRSDPRCGRKNYVDRLARQLSQPINRFQDAVGLQSDATERAQAAAGADRGREFDRSENRRKHQRVFNAEKVDQAAVWPDPVAVGGRRLTEALLIARSLG